MMDLLGTLVFVMFVVLCGALTVHHFTKLRHGFRTGAIEGLMLGYWGKRYNRVSDAPAFWVNVAVGFFVVTFGAIIVLWGMLILAFGVTAYFGQPVV